MSDLPQDIYLIWTRVLNQVIYYLKLISIAGQLEQEHLARSSLLIQYWTKL